MRKLLLLSLLLGVTLHARDTKNQNPQKFLADVANCANRVNLHTRSLDRKYPFIRPALERDIFGPFKPVPASYAEQFDKLFVSLTVVRTDFYEERGVEFDISKYPRRLDRSAQKLFEDWRKEVDESDLATSFGEVDEDYWRTLAASYTFIEYAKRQYYYAGSRFYIADDTSRAQFEKEIRALHYDLQNMMEYMYVLRTDARFRSLDPGKYTPHLFEGTYGPTFHFRQEKLDIMQHGPVRELVYYLLPAAYPNLMQGMKETPLPKKEQLEFIAPAPEKEEAAPTKPEVPSVEKMEKAVPPPPKPGLEAKNNAVEPEVLPTPERQPGQDMPQPKPLTEPKAPKSQG
ncbi:MAG: hypothetical protein KDD39_15465 [Bdellovibrionales bacterium]|nr:hypothetical protein [Bdellovibrionales bacterium]